MSSVKALVQAMNLDEFLTENYYTYGHYVNFHRVIPGIDGLKPVHRRTLIGVREVADGGYTSTVNALGAVQKIHPFGTISIEGSMADMVRIGALQGEGSFGAKLLEPIPAAASRYTRTGISKQQSDYNFKLVDYAPKIEGEVEIEPEYLIVPVPHALTYGALNWGFGTMGRTPAFTYQSMVEAHNTGDYTKLKSNFDYIIDEDHSDLKALWEHGAGKLTLKYTVTRVDGDTILLVGSGELFTPTLSMFNKLVQDGQIIISNESTNKVVVRITRALRARVDMNMVYQMAVRAATKSRAYNILVVKDDKIEQISIKDWLNLTMSIYKEKFQQYKVDRIAKAEYNIKVLELLPIVGRLIIDNKSDEEILKSTDGLTEEILTSIKRKSISSLRRSEYTPEIESIRKDIDKINSEDVDQVIKSYQM